jgi:hypothetical protein
MNVNCIIKVIAVAGSLVLATTGAMAQDSATKPHVPMEKTTAR